MSRCNLIGDAAHHVGIPERIDAAYPARGKIRRHHGDRRYRKNQNAKDFKT
jgi:hypothetical protein